MAKTMGIVFGAIGVLLAIVWGVRGFGYQLLDEGTGLLFAALGVCFTASSICFMLSERKPRHKGGGTALGNSEKRDNECSNCGMVLSSEARFCPECGRKIW